LATRQSTRDIPGPGEVADKDLGTDGSQRVGTFIFASNERTDGKTASTKDLNDLSANSADASRGARDENRSVD
jgi:hypothetical protein